MCAAIPKKIGKFEIQKQIGKGSMGVVYQAYDPFTDQLVAVKVALAESLKKSESGARYRKMFFNEAHTAGMLHHPNIMKILDAGVDEDDCYIVMELVAGADTLKSYCRADNLLPIAQVVEIIFKCAKALDYAHRQGVVHRDIKPTNLLITREKDVRIGDFSIAHLMTTDMSNTMPLGFVGSPRYMSPEQVQEDSITNQTDLFSLGIVMYELLTGRHPFIANSFSRLIHKIINEQQPPLRSYRKDIPDILEKIVHHALQKSPEKRYKMGLNIAADLSLTFDYLEKPQEDIEQEEKLNAVEKLQFFKGFSTAEIVEIINAGMWQTFTEGSQIITEGELEDSFYIIVSGGVSVLKGERVIRQLQAGDCFGEMGYLSKTKRTATIAAASAVQLLKLNALLIEQASLECQLRFSKAFLKTLVQRLSMTTSLYANSDR